MTFQKFYSSSMANLYAVTATNGRRLLLECGCRWVMLEKALDYKLDCFDGALVTHSHADHSRAVEDVLASGIDVYASEGTLRALEPTLHLHRRAHVIRAGEKFRVGSFEAFPFDTEHDAEEPLGFVIHEKPGKDILDSLLFVTDTMLITQRFAVEFGIIAICCSYDKDILKARVKAETISEALAKRLLFSHMEKRVTLRYLKEFCNLGKCREIHLLHMSSQNIDKKKTRKDVEDALFIKTYC